MNLRLTTRIALLTGAISAIASVSVGLLVHQGSVDILYDNAVERLRYEANARALKLKHEIDSGLEDVQYLIGTPPIQGIARATAAGGIDPADHSTLETWKNRLAIIFTEMVHAKPHYRQVRILKIDDDGKELVRVDRLGSLIQRASESRLQKRSKETFYQATKDLVPGEIYISDISLNREFGRISLPHTPIMSISTPIYFRGERWGLLSITLDLSQTLDQIIYSTPRNLLPFIIDSNGDFIAHPDASKTFATELGHNYRIQTEFPALELQHNTDIRDRSRTFVENREDGQYVVHLVETRYDRRKSERFVAVVLAESRNDLLSGSHALRNKALLVILFLTLISLVLAAIFSRRIVRPIRQIAVAADNITQGKEIGTLPVRQQDELGELARSFEKMHDALKHKEKELLKSHSRIYHANKLATLGEMASSIAHEINNPVQEIQLTTERILRNHRKDQFEKIPSAVENVKDAARRIADIVEKLRSMVRQTDEPDSEEVTIQSIIDEAASVCQAALKLNQISLTSEYRDLSGDDLILCQPSEVATILINLLNNSIDALKDLPVKWIKLEINGNESLLEISVTDSGSGISEEMANRIFEPMFTTKNVGEGSGLGLSLASSIAKQHHGELVLDSSSTNTRFVLRLPRNKKQQKPALKIIK